MASGGIDDDDFLVLEALHAVLDDERRILLSGFAVDLDADLLAQLLQLIEGGGPVDVGSDESDRESLLGEVQRQLAGRGGLTLTVQTDHHDGLGLHLEPFAVVHESDELLVDDAHQVLLDALPCGRRLVLGAVLHPVRQFQHELDVDIRLQQSTLEVLADVVDQLVVHRRGVTDPAQDVAKRFTQSFQDHLYRAHIGEIGYKRWPG